MWSPSFWFVILCLLVAKMRFSNCPNPGLLQVGENVPNAKLEMKHENDLNVAALPIPIPAFGAQQGLLSGGMKVTGINEKQRMFADEDPAQSKQQNGRGMGMEMEHGGHRKRHKEVNWRRHIEAK